MRNSVDDVVRQGRSAENYRRQADSYTAAADRAESQVYDERLDLSGAFTGWMIDEKGKSAEQVATLMNGRSDNSTLEGLRAEFAERYIDEMVAPQMQNSVVEPLGSPSDPGAAPAAGEPHNFMDSQFPDLAERRIAAESELHYQNATIGDPSTGAAEVHGRAVVAADRNSEANGQSGSNWIKSGTEYVMGGGMVQDGNRVEWQPSASNAPQPISINSGDRDVLIRTIAAEAGAESRQGQSAVAAVIMNRVHDDRFPDSVSGVVFQPEQFSAWNTDGTGNTIGNQLQTGSATYQQIGNVVDDMFAGNAVDPTGGATHYYSPSGMQAYVDNGHQSNLVPGWWDNKVAESGGSVEIGNHRFAGEARNAN